MRTSLLALLLLPLALGCSSVCCDPCANPCCGPTGDPCAVIVEEAPAETVAETPAEKPAEVVEEEPLEGAATPEELIAAMKEAMEREDGDISGIIPYVLPEQRGMLTFAFAMLAPVMAIAMGEAMVDMKEGEAGEEARAKFDKMKSDFNALLAKHGIEGGVDGSMEAMQSMQGDQEAAMEALAKLFEGVDHAAFIKEASAFMQAQGESTPGMNPGPSADDLKLEDVTIEVDGDTAVANAKGKDEPLHLVKRDGRWFIDFGKMMGKP